jgi:hypothetical protein
MLLVVEEGSVRWKFGEGRLLAPSSTKGISTFGLCKRPDNAGQSPRVFLPHSLVVAVEVVALVGGESRERTELGVQPELVK